MAIYLRSFKLNETYRDIKPFSIDFREGLNLIVGENGSGKSSMLQLISDVQETKTKKVVCEPVDFRYFDTEKNNPRIKGSLADSKNIGYEIQCRFTSHGETMLPIITASEGFKNLLLIIDEPEAGISLGNQKKILEAFTAAVNNKCQIVISTHSYVFISSVPEVFCMDTKKWMTSEKFLKKALA
jgi:predicted ATPase